MFAVQTPHDHRGLTAPKWRERQRIGGRRMRVRTHNCVGPAVAGLLQLDEAAGGP